MLQLFQRLPEIGDLVLKLTSDEEIRAHWKSWYDRALQGELVRDLADANGRYLYANQKLASMLGVTAEDILGLGILTHVHPDDRDRGTPS